VTGAAFDPYREVLAASVVFERLAPVDLDAILARCRLLDVPAGEVVVSEGLPADGLYVILEGRVEFFLPKQGPGGLRRASPVRLNVLGPGRCFGEYGLLDDKPSSASAQTLMPARFCFLPRQDFRRVTEQNDRVGKLIYGNLLQFLVSRLRCKDQELDVFVLADDR